VCDKETLFLFFEEKGFDLENLVRGTNFNIFSSNHQQQKKRTNKRKNRKYNFKQQKEEESQKYMVNFYYYYYCLFSGSITGIKSTIL
jgi:hypothetical protein